MSSRGLTLMPSPRLRSARCIVCALKTGQDVAVKIQYPGMARAIREDFRNFFLALVPGRLNKDWQNTKDQLHDLQTRLERETDYIAEAAIQEQVRFLFREDDGIVVPRRLSGVLDGANLDDGPARRRSHRQVHGARSVAGGAQRIRL